MTTAVLPAVVVGTGFGCRIHVPALRADWDALVNETLAEATLTRSDFQGYITEGKVGLHSEHLSFLLGEMQGLARAHPNANW